MKRFIELVVVLVIAVASTACYQEKGIGDDYLDVTPNNISGVWQMESYDNGVALAEGSYYYIEFIRKDKKFVSYDNLESMGSEPRKRTGRFDITTNASAVIRGMYDYGLGDWEHSYYVRDLTPERMVWVAVDDESIVTVYVRAELPDGLKSEDK